MKRKAVSMLLIGALALWLVGCEQEEPAGTAGKEGATSRAPADEGTVQPVPEGQGGTAGTTDRGRTGGTAGTGGTAAPGQPGAAGDVLNQQKNEYVQGAEQILNNMEQKLTAWQQQAGAQAQQDPKTQELSKQVQTEIADARQAVDKMRTATGTQLKDAKVAADQAIRDAEEAFKNLLSAQTQVTQAQ